MKQLALTLITLITYSVNIGFGQAPNRIAVELDMRKKQRSNTPAQPYALLKEVANADQTARGKEKLAKYTLAKMLPVVSSQLRRSAQQVISLEVPLADEILTLDLFRIADEPIVVRTSDGGVFHDEGMHYRGIMRGDDQSTAAISIYGDEIVGIISSDQYGNVILGKWPEKNAHVIYSDRDLTESQDFECLALDRPNVMNDVRERVERSSRGAAGKCTKIYLEVGHDLYVASDRDRTRVQNYITGIFNQVSTLYANDGLSVQISEIYIWTKADPYSGNASEHLEAFLKRRKSYNGDLAHLITAGKGNGGIAYVDVLCSRNFAYGYSDIGDDYAVFPSYSWTVNVIAHEIGHNLGSPHTHACKWGPLKNKALDNCFSTEGSCDPGPRPNSGGTLMSYCHLRDKGINFNHGLGDEPGERIRERVASAGCLGSCSHEGEDAPVACPLTITQVEVEPSICGDETGVIEITASGTQASTMYTVGTSTQSSNRFIGLGSGSYVASVSNGDNCTVEEIVVINSAESKIVIGSTEVPADCVIENGQVTLSASGGQSPYQFSLGEDPQSSPLFINLAAGSYTAEVTDANGCVSSTKIVVPTSSSPALANSIDHTSCSLTNGRIVLEASGGKAPYSYALGDQTNNTGVFESLDAGNYETSVTDAAGCTSSSVTVEVEASAQISLDFAVQKPDCGANNGQIELAGKDGALPYQYSVDGKKLANAILPAIGQGSYGILVTDANNCESTTTVEVSEKDGPSLARDVIDTRCGDDNGQITLSAEGGSGPYTYSLGDLKNSTGEFAGLSGGSYPAQVKDANDCMSAETELTIEMSEKITSEVLVKSTDCGLVNGRIEISTSGGNGALRYSVGGAFQSTPIFENLPAGEYAVQVLDATQCEVNHDASVAASDGFESEFTLKATSCGENNGAIDIEVNGATGPYQYKLGRQDFIDQNKYENLRPGQYQIGIRDSKGCQVTRSQIIESSTAIEATIDVKHTTCGEPNGELQIDAAGGVGALIYEVNGASRSLSDLENLESGYYRVRIMDDVGCVFEMEQEINPSLEIALRFDVNQPSCGEENGEIKIIATGGTGNLQFGVNDNFGGLQIHQGLGPDDYHVQVRDGIGCEKEEQIVLLPSSAPELTTTIGNTTCGLEDGRLSIAIDHGVGPYDTRVNGLLQADLQVQNLAGGQYNIEVEDALGCVVLGDYKIESSSGPQFEAKITAADCNQSNGSVEIQAALGLAPYQFSIDGAFQDSPVFIDLDAGKYLLAIRDAADCEISEEIAVSHDDRYQAPVLPIEGSICEGETVLLHSGLDDNITVQWYHNDVVITGSEAPMLEVAEAGSYRAEVNYYEGCVLESSSEVTVNTKPEIALPARADICEGAEFSLETVTADHSYEWSHGAEGSDVFFGSSARYVLTVSTPQGCISKESMDVKIIPKKIFDESTQRNFSICAGNSIVLKESGADRFRWYNGDHELISEQSSVEVNEGNSGTYYLIGENTCFSDTALYQINLFFDAAMITSDTSVVEGSAVTLRIAGALEQTWSTSFIQSCVDCNQTEITPQVDGSVFVDYIDTNNCAREREVQIEIIPLKDIIPPLVNVVTPNNDGSNDRLVFKGIENFHSTELRIFDQNGNTIYQDLAYENDWDGYLADRLVPEGIYFYVVAFHLGSRVFEYDSSLTILKN